VPDAPALIVEGEKRSDPRTLVVADVHLGLGSSPERPLGPPEGSADRLADRLVGLARASRADTVLIAGDAKHPIVGTPAALRPVVFDFFAELLREGFPAELVLGNHDVGIVRHLPREVVVHPPTGVVRAGVGIFHGHRWPSNPVLRAPRLVAGHLHPGFRLAPTADDTEGKRRCWIRVERSLPGPAPPRRRRHLARQAREIVILPAFNPIAGTEALNRDRPARGRSFLYRRFLADGVARAYLLDGTDLGVLTTRDATGLRPKVGGRSPRGR
jgi:metallophosphoesterase superfamily enzyme